MASLPCPGKIEVLRHATDTTSALVSSRETYTNRALFLSLHDGAGDQDMEELVEEASHDEVTRLFEAVGRRDREALGMLVPLVYEELQELAHRQRRRWSGDDTLDTTALVHEAYLKLADQSDASWSSRAHFLAAAARAMRHILINYSRDRRALKRGGDGAPRISLEVLDARQSEMLADQPDDTDILLVVDAALNKLEQVNPRQSQIVECRFFGGMTIAETAIALGVSTATVSRGWALAQVRLYQELRSEMLA
jgi:RNA polymerase sigma factor (TIGR02999 family)